MKNKLLRFSVTAAVLLNLTLATPKNAVAADDVGLWVGGGVISLIYTPIKAAFFLFMGITGGLSAIVTAPLDEIEYSARWIKWGFYGDWLIRPDHLRGENTPQFVGTKEEIRFVDLRLKRDTELSRSLAEAGQAESLKL